MRNLTIFALAATLTVAAVFAPVAAQPAHAQAVFQSDRVANGDSVSGGVTDDTDVAMLIKYIGSNALAKVEVTVTTSDITFTSGATGAEADSTLECPVSGALGGVIDVSNASCNTLGEIVDVINASGSWRAVIVDGMRTDSADGRLLALAATSAQSADGLAINWDTSTAFEATYAMTTARKMGAYIDNRSSDLVTDPFAGTRAMLVGAKATSTYGSGTSVLEVWSVKVNNNSTQGSETATRLWTQAAGATTAEKIFDIFQFLGLESKKGEKLIVRLKNSAAMSSMTFFAAGKQYRYN